MFIKTVSWFIGVTLLFWLLIMTSAGVGEAKTNPPISPLIPSATTTTWFVETPAALAGYDLKKISCPSLTVCKALSNQIIFGWDGFVWVKEYEIPDGPAYDFEDIDCPTVDFCKAVGQKTSILSWDGTSWMADPGTENYFSNSVSCVSPDFCMVSSNHEFLSWDGQSWQLFSLGENHRTHYVTCTSSTFCMSSMTFFYGSHVFGGYIARWDGTTWTESIGAPHGSSFGLISCTSSTYCQAPHNPHLYVWDGTAWVSREISFRYHTWHCFSSTFCRTTNRQNIYLWNGEYGVTEYWNPDSYINHMDCYSPTFCKSVGAAGMIFNMLTQSINNSSQGFKLKIDQAPSCLTSVEITELAELPPYATSEMLPGRSWQVAKEGCNQPIIGSLTLPMPVTLEPTDMVCTYTGRLWQCVEPTYNPELMTQTTINGYIHLGDWAIRRPGPNSSAHQIFLPLFQTP